MQTNNQLTVLNTESKESVILQEKIEKFAYIIVGIYNYFNLFIDESEIIKYH